MWVLETENDNYYFDVFYMGPSHSVSYAYELRLNDLNTPYVEGSYSDLGNAAAS